MDSGASIFDVPVKPRWNTRDYGGGCWHTGTRFNHPLQTDGHRQRLPAVHTEYELSSRAASGNNTEESWDLPIDSGSQPGLSVQNGSTHSSAPSCLSVGNPSVSSDSCGSIESEDTHGKRKKLMGKIFKLLVVVFACLIIAAAIAVAVLLTRDEVQTFSAIIRVNETFNDSMAQSASDAFQNFEDRFCFNVVSFLGQNFSDTRCQVNSLSSGSIIVNFTLEVLATTNSSETQRHLTAMFNVSQVGVMPIFPESCSFSCTENSTHNRLPPMKPSSCSSDSTLPILPLNYTFPYHCGEYQVCSRGTFVPKKCPIGQEFAYLTLDDVLICAPPSNLTTYCERERGKQQTTNATPTSTYTAPTTMLPSTGQSNLTSVTSTMPSPASPTSPSTTKDDNSTYVASTTMLPSTGQDILTSVTTMSSPASSTLPSTTTEDNSTFAASTTLPSSPGQGNSTSVTSMRPSPASSALPSSTKEVNSTSTASTTLLSSPGRGNSTSVTTTVPSQASTSLSTIEQDNSTYAASTTLQSSPGKGNSTYVTTTMPSLASSSLSTTKENNSTNAASTTLPSLPGQSNLTSVTTSVPSQGLSTSPSSPKQDNLTHVTSITSTTGQSLTPDTTFLPSTGRDNSTNITTSMPSPASSTLPSTTKKDNSTHVTSFPSTLEESSTLSTRFPSSPAQSNSTFPTTSTPFWTSSTTTASSTRQNNSTSSTSTLKQPTTSSTSSTQMFTSLAPTITETTVDNSVSSSLTTTTTSATTTEWKPVYTCPSTGYAFLPAHDTYPNNCSKYQVCQHGVPTIMCCAAGTEFVYSNIPSEQVACDHINSTSTFCSKMKTLSSSLTPSTTLLSSSVKDILLPVTTAETTSDSSVSSSLSTTTPKTTTTTTEWNPVYTCPSTGYAFLPANDTYPDNCAKYQVCQHGVPTIMYCAAGTDFVYSNIPSEQVACDYIYSSRTFCNKMKTLSSAITPS